MSPRKSGPKRPHTGSPESISLAKKVRDKTGWSQQRLGKHLGVSRVTFARWVTGVQEPDFGHSEKLKALLAEGQTSGVASPQTTEEMMEQRVLEFFRLLPIERRVELFTQLRNETEKNGSQAPAAHPKE